ncbi:LysR substrate-binding domain-containing protein [Salibacterium sp. K-3]
MNQNEIQKTLGEANLDQIQFRLNQASMEEMALLIESGEIDFGFTAMPIHRTGIRELPVLNVEVFLAAPPRTSIRETT